MIQFDEHIFQMGWNHQLVLHVWKTKRLGSTLEMMGLEEEMSKLNYGEFLLLSRRSFREMP